MTEHEVLIYIIVALVALLIGGTGGAALLRKTLKMPEETPGQASAQSAASAAAMAASAAAATAATTATSMLDRMRLLENEMKENTGRLNHLDNTISAFMGACPEKHNTINYRLDNLERKD